MAYSLEQKISKDKLADFCKRNHIRKLSVFGSAVRGELLPDSDIDLLVEFEQDLTPGLFSIVRMEMELAEELREEVPDIPWSVIIGMRNRLIHAY